MTYFDTASAAPLHPAAREALLAALDEGWADPARLYGEARRARLLLDGARETIAGLLGARADEVTFTGSGTQAAHLAVLGGTAGRRRAGQHLVTTAIEHSSVLAAAAAYERQGGEVTTVGVDRQGRVAADDVRDALRRDTALVSVMAANHEVGTVQPVTEIAAGCAEAGVPLHTDAAQVVGRADLPGGWSLLSASAHKWGGPPGVGVLAVRKGNRWRSPLPADQRGTDRVPGPPNVPGVVAAAAALAATQEERVALADRLSPLVKTIRSRVAAEIPDVEVVGDPERRLSHLVTFSVLYVDGEALLTELDRLGFAVSSGSSCTSSTLAPSHVLEAMGVLSHGNIRVSLHRETTAREVEDFLGALPDVVRRLRTAAGVAEL